MSGDRIKSFGALTDSGCTEVKRSRMLRRFGLVHSPILVVCLLSFLPTSRPVMTGDITELILRAERTPTPPGFKANPKRAKRNQAGELIGLNLDYVVLKPGDMEVIAKCKKLESLWLSRTNVTDKHLKWLVGMTNLKYLRLNHTTIGDAGLKYIGQIKSLKSVCLGKVNATPKAITQLLLKRPRLSVGYIRRKS